MVEQLAISRDVVSSQLKPAQIRSCLRVVRNNDVRIILAVLRLDSKFPFEMLARAHRSDPPPINDEIVTRRVFGFFLQFMLPRYDVREK